MRKQSFLLAASLLVAAVASANAIQESITLRLKLDPDKAYSFSLKGSTAGEVMGMDMSSTNEITAVHTVAKGEKGMVVTTTNKDIKMTVAEGSPMEGQLDQAKEALANLKTIATYDDRGNQLDFKLENASATGQLGQGAGGLGMGFLGLTYPEQALKVGDTWKVEYDMGKMLAAMGMPSEKKQVMPVTYTVKKIEEGVVTILSLTKGTLEITAPTGQTVNVATTAESTFLVDAATGIPNQVDTEGSSEIDFGMGQMVTKTKQSMKRLKD